MGKFTWNAKKFVKEAYVSAKDLRSTFSEIEPDLIRYPAIDGDEFRRKVESFIASMEMP